VNVKIAASMLLALSVASAYAQSPHQRRVVGDGEFADAQSPDRNALMQAQADYSIAALARVGALARSKAQAAVNDLQWPLQPLAGFDQFDYHGTKNFVDHDQRFPGFVQDYTCGTRSYDLASGYNHAGVDYYLWPFPWLMMDQGLVQIVAAAPGVIAARADGNVDRNCAIASTTDPNFVRVLQDDGLSAIYLHMRSGSVTSLPVGARVGAGEYLGTVGSSGQSSGPHLHFELRDASGNVVDPRNGQCNAAPDRWIVFQRYEDPHIDTLSTHSAEPAFIDCGVDGGGNVVDEVPNYKTAFMPGDALWVFVSYRDQRNGQVTNFSIQRPDDSAFAQWDFDLASQNEPSPFYSGTGFDWRYDLPADAPNGAWKVSAKFAGQTYTRAFTVGEVIFHGNFSSAASARVQLAADVTRCRPRTGQASPPGCDP
jgi:murein DD-endopeptidase MepM/ murein hydrolase activator NlpD